MISNLIFALSASSAFAIPLLETRQTSCYNFTTTQTLSCTNCPGTDLDEAYGFNDGNNVAFNDGIVRAEADVSKYSSGVSQAGRTQFNKGLASNYIPFNFSTVLPDAADDHSVVCNTNQKYASGWLRAYKGDNGNYPTYNSEYNTKLNALLAVIYQAGYDAQAGGNDGCFPFGDGSVSCTNCVGNDGDFNIGYNDGFNQATLEGTTEGTTFGNGYTTAYYEAGLIAGRSGNPSNFSPYNPNTILIPDPNHFNVCLPNVRFQAGWAAAYRNDNNAYAQFNVAFLAAVNAVLEPAYNNGFAAGQAAISSSVPVSSASSSNPVGPTAEARLRQRRARQISANAAEAK